MTHLGWKPIFVRFENEVWEVRRVMTQKPRLSDQVRLINVILNQDTSLSYPQTLIAHLVISNVYI